MTKEDLEQYYQTPDGKKVKDFIENEQQDAVVYSVTTDKHYRHIKLWSPVWKTICITQDRTDRNLDEVQRGDIVSLSRWWGSSEYYIKENKTASQIKQDSIGKILKDFDEAQQQNILFISEYQRLNKKK